MLVGFEDGVVRCLTLQTCDEVDIHGRKRENVSELVLKQAFKPHNDCVVTMALDSKGEILATGVSRIHDYIKRNLHFCSYCGS